MNRGIPMKKKSMAATLSLLLVIGVSCALFACSKDESDELVVPSNVKSIDPQEQTSGDEPYTNYRVTITNDTDWNNMSREDQQVIVNYCFNECKNQIEENGVIDYIIMGVKESGEVLFIYDRDNDVIIVYKDGLATDRLPIPTQ